MVINNLTVDARFLTLWLLALISVLFSGCVASQPVSQDIEQPQTGVYGQVLQAGEAGAGAWVYAYTRSMISRLASLLSALGGLMVSAWK